MKVHLTLAFTILFAGLLDSCQQAYVDTQARENGGVPSATLSAPSVSPSSATLAASSSYVDATSASGFLSVYAQPIVDSVIGQISSTLNTISSSVAAPGFHPIARGAKGGGTSSGTPGYLLTSGSYTVGTATDGYSYLGNSLTGAATVLVSKLNYEEELQAYDDYVTTASTVSRLFKKAMHWVDSNQATVPVAYDDGNGTVANGTLVVKNRGETFEDIFTGDISQTTYYGIAETSIGCVIALSQNTGSGSTLGGKIVISAVLSQPFSNANAGGGSVELIYNVDVYDNLNHKVLTTGTSSPVFFSAPPSL